MLHTHRDVYDFEDEHLARRRRNLWFVKWLAFWWIVVSVVLALLGFFLSVFLITLGCVAGGLVAYLGVRIGHGSGNTLEKVMRVTMALPYQDHFSQEDALVMQRRVPEALAMLEAKIAAPDSGIPVRLRTAELHAKEGANPARAAELFRQIQQHPSCDAGQYAYATNRLVDLLTGPLNDPGRAMGELRRLIDRSPGSVAAANARAALVALKQYQREASGA
jgi:hypothetical protein